MQDIPVVWRYAKVGNVDFYSLVQNSEDPSHVPTFRDFMVEVSSGSDINSLVERRTQNTPSGPDFVMVESYLYTIAMNQGDAGGMFQPQVRFVVTVRDTAGNLSEPKTLDVLVVS